MSSIRESALSGSSLTTIFASRSLASSFSGFKLRTFSRRSFASSSLLIFASSRYSSGGRLLFNSSFNMSSASSTRPNLRNIFILITIESISLNPCRRESASSGCTFAITFASNFLASLFSGSSFNTSLKSSSASSILVCEISFASKNL